MHGYVTWDFFVVYILAVPRDTRCFEARGGNEAWPVGLDIEIVFFIFPEAFAHIFTLGGCWDFISRVNCD